jgi:rhodanese-related sulfurtransferase
MKYTDINVAEFSEKLNQNENYVLLDVRTADEVAEAKIGDPLNIDIFGEDFSDKVNELDKTKNYLVYCRSGRRSANACIFMAENGFSGELYNLEGGILDWLSNHSK